MELLGTTSCFEHQWGSTQSSTYIQSVVLILKTFVLLEQDQALMVTYGHLEHSEPAPNMYERERRVPFTLPLCASIILFAIKPTIC